MGREVRRVPADWQHPKDDHGRFIPMHEQSFEAAFKEWTESELSEWLEGRAHWALGEVTDYHGGWEPIPEKYAADKWEDYAGTAPTSPNPRDYMPDWPEEVRTHFMMYETCSEGTPISPAFATPEELAHWLADTGASSFGSMTASYGDWLRVCQGGYAPSAVVVNGQLKSGVEGV